MLLITKQIIISEFQKSTAIESAPKDKIHKQSQQCNH